MVLKKLIRNTEDKLVILTLPALALIPCVQMIIRFFFTTDIPQYDALIRHLTLWVAMITGSICTREGQHINLGFVKNFKNMQLKKIIVTTTQITGATLSLSLALAAVSFSIVGFGSEQRLGPFSLSIVSLIMALSLMATGMRFIASEKEKIAVTATTSLILTFFLSLPVIINLLYLTPFLPPIWMENMLDAYYFVFERLDFFFIFFLILLTVLGLPIFILLCGAAFVLFAGAWGVPEVIPNEMYNLLTGSAIPAIPLFTFTGFILSEGKSGERLVNFFKAFLGKLPGGLSVMAVLVCAFFTTFTGASGVTILALGGLLSYIMIESGDYSEKFTKGYITSAGSIGLLFPPSLPIIMYAVQAQISVKDMFVAGIIPGIILVIALAIMGIIHTLRHHPQRGKQIEKNDIERLKSLKNAAGDLALPVIILLLYFGGITTLVETGAVAVVYSIVLEVVIYRKLKLTELAQIIKKTAPVIGGVLMIVAMAKGLSYFIVDAEVPMLLTDFFSNHVSSPLMFLLLLNGVLLITGCLMDIFSAIMVVAPLIIPLGEMYGINPVQLGIIFLANLQLGYLTPPVGLNLFLASYAFKTPLSRIYKGVIPFFLIMIAVVLLITYVPWFSLALL